MFRSSILAGMAGFALLTGCSLNVGGSLGLGGSVDRQGQAVSDEPYATKVGAAILAQGGSAADAASAMYFALTVTYPAAASLGGGGVCLIRDERKNVSEQVVFLPQRTGDGTQAVGGAVAAFAAIERDYGVLPWQKVVSPAESYARTGVPLSHALAGRIDAARLKVDPALAALLLDEAGAPKKAGTILTNQALAETLTAIRIEGGAALIDGSVAKKIAAAGDAVTAADLAAAAHVVRANPTVIELGGNYVFLPSAKTGIGGYAVALTEVLSHGKSTSVEAAATQVQGRLGLSAASESGATGFAAIDARGQSVACTVGLGTPFGAAHSVAGTGLIPAVANDAANAYQAPMIVSSSSTGPAIAAAAASGPAGTALIADAFKRMGHGETLATRADLHPVAAIKGDTGNLIVCTSRVCTALADPSSAGLGLSVAK